MDITINVKELFGLTEAEMTEYLQNLLDTAIDEGSFEILLNQKLNRG